MLKTRLVRSSKWPSIRVFGGNSVLIYDRRLDRACVGFSKWRAQFRHSYPVVAGENLKDVTHFSRHIHRILQLSKNISPRDLTLVVVGGGSVGDFGGFVASVLKRGVRLIHVPSTWLAALDSSHGGKTALNVAGAKNQIGTFYPSAQTWLIKPLLLGQPPAREVEAAGELIKMAIIDGGPWTKTMTQDSFGQSQIFNKSEFLWESLPHVVRAKMRVVEKDPHEKNGVRQILNLGHTWGHVLEAAHGLPHGIAVAYGLLFALGWSTRLGHHKTVRSRPDTLSKAWRLVAYAYSCFYPKDFFNHDLRLSRARAQKLLQEDKKLSSKGSIRFVFIRDLGKVFVRPVPISQMLRELQRQGWLK